MLIAMISFPLVINMFCISSLVCFAVTQFQNKKLYNSNNKQWAIQDKPAPLCTDDQILRWLYTQIPQDEHRCFANPFETCRSICEKKEKNNPDTGFAELPWPNLSCGLLGF